MLKVAAMGKVAGTHKSFERTVLWLANCPSLIIRWDFPPARIL